jgi:aquaporin Z
MTAIPTRSVMPAADRARTAIRWRECAMEAALLGLFMVSACAFGVLLAHPASPVARLITSPLARRASGGLAMGLTAVALIYSPWGRRSGANMNPATTLCFLRLGRIGGRDAIGYMAAQFAGAAAGVAVAAAALGPWVRDPAVNFVATRPGPAGPAVAWAAEFAIAFVMMATVLAVNQLGRLSRYTGVVAGTLVALYITFEAPLSGMSLNPARTLASAVWAQLWDGLWVYFTAPPAGMLAAVEVQRLLVGRTKHLCGKWSHSENDPCVFRCDCLTRRGI